MKRLATVAFAVLLATVSASLPVSADDGLGEAIAGRDGIVVRCVVSTKERYVENICRRLSTATTNYAAEFNIPLIYQGKSSVKDGIDYSDTSSFDRPLHLTFFVRGTSARTPAISVRAVVGVHFRQAVEAKQSAQGVPPLTGLLVLWQEAAVASGPKKKVAAAIAAHIAGDVERLLEKIEGRLKP